MSAPIPSPQPVADALRNLVEPVALLRHFVVHPPQDFTAIAAASGAPGFVTRFDLLTTLDAPLRERLLRRAPARWLAQRILRPRTAFWGTTVSEYCPLPSTQTAPALMQELLAAARGRGALTIVKDLPEASPLLSAEDNAFSAELQAACQTHGFILVDGQALAYVPIDAGSEDDYLAGLSAGRRRDIRRKLRARKDLEVEILHTGDSRFADEAWLAELYALYLAVYAQSELHFDLLTPAFFRAVLQDATLAGRVFLYRHQGELIGYNLCLVQGDKLIDKYVGLRYPAAREHNLYFVSWMENLAYARAQGLKYYVAGWTDPEIKAYLGARFTFTRHAVWVRNPLLRVILRPLAHLFESDRAWFDAQAKDAATDT